MLINPLVGIDPHHLEVLTRRRHGELPRHPNSRPHEPGLLTQEPPRLSPAIVDTKFRHPKYEVCARTVHKPVVRDHNQRADLVPHDVPRGRLDDVVEVQRAQIPQAAAHVDPEGGEDVAGARAASVASRVREGGHGEHEEGGVVLLDVGVVYDGQHGYLGDASDLADYVVGLDAVDAPLDLSVKLGLETEVCE